MQDSLLVFVPTEKAERTAQCQTAQEGQAEDHAEQGCRVSSLATNIAMRLGPHGGFATNPVSRIIDMGLGLSGYRFHAQSPFVQDGRLITSLCQFTSLPSAKPHHTCFYQKMHPRIFPSR